MREGSPRSGAAEKGGRDRRAPAAPPGRGRSGEDERWGGARPGGGGSGPPILGPRAAVIFLPSSLPRARLLGVGGEGEGGGGMGLLCSAPVRSDQKRARAVVAWGCSLDVDEHDMIRHCDL